MSGDKLSSGEISHHKPEIRRRPDIPASAVVPGARARAGYRRRDQGAQRCERQMTSIQRTPPVAKATVTATR